MQISFVYQRVVFSPESMDTCLKRIPVCESLHLWACFFAARMRTQRPQKETVRLPRVSVKCSYVNKFPVQCQSRTVGDMDFAVTCFRVWGSVLHNAECKSGGVQKLSGAVFCTRPTVEKLTILYQINGELV